MSVEPHIVRPYQPADRAALRRIAADTADAGRPVENFFSDREFVCDFISGYYTDVDPSETWVAESGGRVVGYLCGCFDTRRYLKAMSKRVVPGAIARGISRGLLWNPEAWRFVFAGIRTGLKSGNYRNKYLDRYPAHLHINVDHTFRGTGAGGDLMDAFEKQAREAGLSGCHLGTRCDNESARGFFERKGFRGVEEVDVYFPERSGLTVHRLCVYVKSYR
ncbi:MAG: GNAT family N-acetyltransferase [Elusimicrobia bacterium]|nr:GNAT family N-acetyltransferase [Elusimicrobiota bacterium]